MIHCVGCEFSVAAGEIPVQFPKGERRDILDVMAKVITRRINEIEGMGIFRTTIKISPFLSLLLDKVYSERMKKNVHITIIRMPGFDFDLEVASDTVDSDVIEEMYGLLIS